MHTSDPPETTPLPIPVTADDREMRLIEAVVEITRTLRDDRDRLAKRLRELEYELSVVVAKLDARAAAAGEGVGRSAGESVSGPETDAPADRLRRSSRTRG